MTDYDDEFNWEHLETGLPDDIDGTIKSPEFGYRADYVNGEKLCLWFTLVDPKTGEEYGGEQKLGVGDGWEVEDGGRRVVRADGSVKNFHGNTNMGTALGTMVKEGGVKLNELVKKRGANPTMVDFWDGMTFHWLTKDYENTINGEDAKWSWLLPVALVDDGTGKKSTASETKAAETPAASTASAKPKGKAKAGGGASADTLGIDPGVYQRIFDIAYEADDYESFKEKCYTDVPECMDDPEVLAVVEGVQVWDRAVEKYEADNPVE